jgi:hypothetical protein
MILDGSQKLVATQALKPAQPMLKIIPLYGSEDNIVRVCIVLKPTGESWDMALLRSFAGGRFYLGALTDRGGRVREWLEIGIQTVGGLGQAFRVAGASLNNAALDARWRDMVAAVKTIDPAAWVETGYETRHPPPLWLDQESGKSVMPADEDGVSATLCTDDQLLTREGLPPYSASLARYLFIGGRPEKGFSIQARDEGAFKTPEQPAWAIPTEKLIALNPEGGLLLVRRRATLKLLDFARFLSGHDLQALQDDAFSSHYLGGLTSGFGHWDFVQRASACLLPTSRGKPGRFLETFHHKLLVFSKMVQAVHETVRLQQLPLLNLTPASFRVDFAEPAGDLPLLWTSRISLVEPSVAVGVPLKHSKLRYFRTLSPASASIYRPGQIGNSLSAMADLRIRRVKSDHGVTIVECTVGSPEPLSVRDTDLVWFEVHLPGAKKIDIFGRLDTSQAMAAGERRFESLPLTWPEEDVEALRRHEGRVLTSIPLETIPLMSTPCDLYALGVIGVQIFLVSSKNTLPVALDEMLSLARELGNVPDSGAPTMGEKVKWLSMRDARWNAALGPQYHGHDCASSDEGFSWVPVELWWDVIGTLCRFFPGAGNSSFLRNFEDVKMDVSLVFVEPETALNRLVQTCQSLLLSDWVANREIARIIQQKR